MRESGMWICTNCEHIYEQQHDDSDRVILTGTLFGDVPEGWVYPICGVGRINSSHVQKEKMIIHN